MSRINNTIGKNFSYIVGILEKAVLRENSLNNAKHHPTEDLLA